MGTVLDDVGSRVMFFGSFLDMLATRGRPAGARWRQDGPRMGHDSTKMGHDSGKMGILSSTWELLGQFWEHFSRILGDGWESEKHCKSLGFLWFFALLGGSEEVSEASWGLSWTISEHFRTCWR